MGITGQGIKPTDPVTMHRYGKATRHVFVEPVTGTILDGKEDQSSTTAPRSEPAAAHRDPRIRCTLKGTFKWADSTVARQADKADHYKGLLKMAPVLLPLILGIIGALLIPAWLWLFLRDRCRTAADGPSGDSAFDYEARAPAGAWWKPEPSTRPPR